MAYTAPTTRITGDVITSGHWNTDIGENIKWLATDKPMCRVYASSTQGISSGGFTSFPQNLTTLTFDSESYKNVTAMHSTSSDTSRIVIPVTGKYMVGWRTTALIPAASNWGITGFVRINADNALLLAPSALEGTNNANALVMSAVGQVDVYAFTANDYIEVRLGHTNAASASVSFGHASVDGRRSTFWCHWVGN